MALWSFWAITLAVATSATSTPSTSTRFDYLSGNGYIEASVKPELLGGTSFYAELSFKTTAKVIN